MTAARRVVVVALLTAAAVLVSGAAVNLVAIGILSARHPVPGAFFDVDGRAMHMYCTGHGSPTVVLEGGLGDDWIYWQKVQPDAARTSRVCSYDRAGIGWSEPQPGPRDATIVAGQLHALLRKAGEAPPLVLVGASAGAFYVRAFAAMFPAEVAGVVFVDGSVPEQTRELPGSRYSAAVATERHRGAAWEWLKEASGWARLTGACTGEVDQGLDAYADLERAAACRPSFATSWLRECDDFWRSADEARDARCCGELPLLVISHDPDRPKPGWTAENIAAQPIWNRLQERLKALSPRSRRVIARNSGHHVMFDRPDVVVRGIRDVVNDVRARAPGSDAGTTTIQ